MLKKGHALFISFLTWCLTMLVSSWAAAGCIYNPDATFSATLRDWTASEGMCWFCPVFETLFKAINNLVTSMSQYMSTFFLNLMGIGILFLIAFKVGRMLVQLQDVDLMQFLGDLFKPLGRAIIATALLGAMTFSGDTIYHLLIQPIFDVSLFLGEQTLNIAVANTEVFTATQSSGEVIRQAGGTVMEACNYRGTLPDKTVFTSRELQQLICWMRTVSSSLGVGIAIGSTFIKIGFTEFLDHINMIIPGILIFIAFFINYVMFPFKLLETFVRLAFVLMLTPLWIILWVFPATVQYTKKAWEMFLGCCLVMISLSVIVALVIQIMNNSIQPDGVSEQLFIELGCGKTDKALEKVETGGMALFILLAFGFMSWSILGTASALAGTFISVGGDLGLEKGVAQNAVQAGGLAWKGTKTTGRLGWAGAKTTARLGWRGAVASSGMIKKGAGKIKDALQNRKQNKNASAPAAPHSVYPGATGGNESDGGTTPTPPPPPPSPSPSNNDAKKNQEIQSGIDNVFNSSHNHDRYDDQDKKTLNHFAGLVHQGRMTNKQASEALKNYFEAKNQQTGKNYDTLSARQDMAKLRSVHREADLKYDKPPEKPQTQSIGTTATESQEQAVKDINSINQVNQNAQRMESAARAAGEAAGQQMGEAAGRAAGSQSARDELGKRRN